MTFSRYQVKLLISLPTQHHLHHHCHIPAQLFQRSLALLQLSLVPHKHKIKRSILILLSLLPRNGILASLMGPIAKQIKVESNTSL